MPIKRASFKDIRKSVKRHYKNTSTKTELHSITKKFEGLVAAKKIDEAKSILRTLTSKIDRAASKGIIHKNAASRKTSRLMHKLKDITS